jgi:hypothetical protein
MALTKQDKEYIEQLLASYVINSQNTIITHLNKHDDQLEALNEKVSHLPTKEEFYEQNDKLIKELQASRTEEELLSHRVSDHEDRITSLETKTV